MSYFEVCEEKHLDEMRLEVRQLNIKMGWRDTDGSTTNTVGDMVALLHSEVTEILEEYRDHKLESFTTEQGKPCDVGSEMADVLIRLLDMADMWNINLQGEYERKMAYNRERPWRHGGRTL